MDRWLADTSARYVGRLRDLARHLDTAIRRQADGIPAEHWPQLHDPSRWLRPDFHDLKAACDQAGEAGDAIFLAALRVFDDVSKVVADYRGSGSVDAWASCRDRVLDDLDTISASPAGEVVRSASPQADTRQHDSPLRERARRILEHLREWTATKEGDRVTRENIAEELGMSLATVKREITGTLRPRGFVETKRGAGVLLTRKGIDELARGEA